MLDIASRPDGYWLLAANPVSAVCETDAYAVRYPADWLVLTGDGVVPPCRLFNPEPVTLQEGTEVPTTIATQLFVETRRSRGWFPATTSGASTSSTAPPSKSTDAAPLASGR